MSTYYSFQKGKFGGVVGTIYPFPRTLSGDTPLDADWKTYVPAGFLRCNGAILKADDYKALAEIIGVGDDCIYRKDGITLDNRNSNGTGGQIQLPDFGSKYLSSSSSNTSLVLDATAVEPDTQQIVERVGIGVELVLNRGEDVTFNYTGNFSVPTTPIPISGNYLMNVPFQSSTSSISQSQMLTHGHYSNAARLMRSVVKEREFSDGTRDDSSGELKTDITEAGQIGTTSAGSVSSTQHEHGLSRTNPTSNVSAQLNSFELDGSAVTTTVNLGSSNTSAFNDVTQKFILVEYLIKF